MTDHTEQQRCPTCKSPDREVFFWSIASGEGCNWSTYDPWHKGSATEPTPTKPLHERKKDEAFAEWQAKQAKRRQSGATAQTAPSIEQLYEAYLLGCEDECIPEPKTIEEFKSVWQGAIK